MCHVSSSSAFVFFRAALGGLCGCGSDPRNRLQNYVHCGTCVVPLLVDAGKLCASAAAEANYSARRQSRAGSLALSIIAHHYYPVPARALCFAFGLVPFDLAVALVLFASPPPYRASPSHPHLAVPAPFALHEGVGLHGVNARPRPVLDWTVNLGVDDAPKTDDGDRIQLCVYGCPDDGPAPGFGAQ